MAHIFKDKDGKVIKTEPHTKPHSRPMARDSKGNPYYTPPGVKPVAVKKKVKAKTSKPGGDK